MDYNTVQCIFCYRLVMCKCSNGLYESLDGQDEIFTFNGAELSFLKLLYFRITEAVELDQNHALT